LSLVTTIDVPERGLSGSFKCLESVEEVVKAIHRLHDDEGSSSLEAEEGVLGLMSVGPAGVEDASSERSATRHVSIEPRGCAMLECARALRELS